MAKEKSVFDRLKKQNGESFAKAIRNFDNGILELPNLLEIVKFAGKEAEPIIPYLRMLKRGVPDKHGVYQDPITLLKQAGYDAFVADTKQKKNSIKHYYAPGEEICTFKDGTRHEYYYIIHAVKEGADKLNRQDFYGRENRQDAYGTSVISIQILKSGNFISIKNRYNHTVEACDNTFDSNPDNIISGLSDSLKRYFNVDFAPQSVCLPSGYVYQNAIYQYHQERDNIYFGDGFYLKNGKVTEIDKNSEIMVDHMVINLKTKDVFTPVIGAQPTAQALKAEIAGKVLQVKNIKGTKILLADGKEVLRTKESQLISLTLQSEFIPDDAFSDVEFLKELKAPNLKKLSGTSFKYARLVKKVDIRSCEQISASTFMRAPNDIEINMQALKEKKCYQIGKSILSIQDKGAKILNSYSMQEALCRILEREFEGKNISVVQDKSQMTIFASNRQIAKVRNNEIVELCLVEAKCITKQMSAGFTHCLERLELVNAEEIERDTLNNNCIGYFKAPNLKKIGSFCLTGALEIDTPSVEIIGQNTLNHIDTNQEVYLPKLKSVGRRSLTNATIYAPELKQVADLEILKYTQNLMPTDLLQIGFSGHLKVGKNIELVKLFLEQSDLQKSPLYKFLLNEMGKAEQLEIKHDGLSHFIKTTIIADGNEIIELSRLGFGRVTHLSLPHLEQLPAGLIKDFKKLKKVSLPDLIQMEAENLKSCPELEDIHLPKLKKIGDSCLNHLDTVECLIIPQLQSMGAHCFRNLKSLRRLDVPRLKTANHRFLHRTNALERFYAPNLKNRLSFLRYHKNYRLILRNMYEPNTSRNKEKVPFFRALIYKENHQKK